MDIGVDINAKHGHCQAFAGRSDTLSDSSRDVPNGGSCAESEDLVALSACVLLVFVGGRAAKKNKAVEKPATE